MITCISDVRNLTTLIFYASLLTVTKKTCQRLLKANDWRDDTAVIVSDDISLKANQQICQILLLLIALMIIPFLPATNLFAYVGFVVAERVLYLPSVAYCLLVSLGCQQWLGKWPILFNGQVNNKQTADGIAKKVGRCKVNQSVIVVFNVLSLMVTFASRTLVRNSDWRDEEHLYRSAIDINPAKGTFLSVKLSDSVNEIESTVRML